MLTCLCQLCHSAHYFFSPLGLQRPWRWIPSLDERRRPHTVPGEVQVKKKKKFLLRKHGWALAQLPMEWWSHHPWRCSGKEEMWHWGTWSVGMVGMGWDWPNDLTGLVKPYWFYGSKINWVWAQLKFLPVQKFWRWSKVYLLDTVTVLSVQPWL